MSSVWPSAGALAATCVPTSVPPPGVIERLRVSTLKAVDDVQVRRRLEGAGWRIMSMSPEETRAFVKREAEKWPAILRQAGIKPE